MTKSDSLTTLQSKTQKTVERMDKLAGAPKRKKLKSVTAGKKVVHFSTRLLEGLEHDIKIYCAQHRMKIQDFMTEAVQDRLKKK